MLKKFKTNDVVIRKFRVNDVESLYNNLVISNDVTYVSNIVINKSKNETQRIVESAVNEYYTEEPIWALEEKKTKNIVGFIRVDKYSPKNKFCTLSWAISDTINNANLMPQALIKVMNYLFEKKGIELIECSYFEQSERTGKVLDNVGMKKEAVLKDRRFNEETNRKENYVIYSIDINEFNNVNV